MERAFITGITGQDGSYLAEHLLAMNYEVWGLIRRASTGPNLRNIESIRAELHLIEGDVTDQNSIDGAIDEARPDQIYNLAAQSFVPLSWSSPSYTAEVNFSGLAHVLETARRATWPLRIYQASTSEMFGNAGIVGPLTERSAMIPRSPYGVAKLAAHRLAGVYRESYGMQIWCGVMFNHESPRRGRQFVTRKITSQVAQIYAGKRDVIELGNLDAARDWGFAGDYVRAMHMMLASGGEPRDYVVGTGKAHTVREFLMAAFECAADLTGEELDKYPMDYVVVSGAYLRPAEIHNLVANPARIQRDLGWVPLVNFGGLVRSMVAEDLRAEGLID